MVNTRIERVQRLLQSEIAKVIDQEVRNPNIPPFVTVKDVKVSKDLSSARVMITLLEDQDEATIRRTIDELNRSAGFVSTAVADRVRLKRHPKLRFEYDPSTHRALDMEHLFRQIHREEAQGQTNPADEAPGQTEGDPEPPDVET